jgi:thiol:disulfide interchange protein
MRKKSIVVSCTVCVLLSGICAWGGSDNKAVELLRYEKEFSTARLEPARLNGKAGIAVIFEGTGDLHYYAKKENAPGGCALKITAGSDSLKLGDVVFPQWKNFFDKTQRKNIEVYAGNFVVFVPIESGKPAVSSVDVTIAGVACTSMICLTPFEKVLKAEVDYSQAELWKEISFKAASAKASGAPNYSMWFALVLALVAGLTLNIMPCVWPVLPLIVMRIVQQSKQDKTKAITMGLAFCLGILLFFACLAGVNIILQLFYGTVLQWGDQFRNPAFVAGMAILLVVMALFMFGLFTIGLPAAVTTKQVNSKGFGGSVAMGFFAAVLSTPCSFGILAAAFAWAQAQPLVQGTTAIMVIGAGMAVPYAILTLMPGLLNQLPKSGKWMELFKQGIGFVLLIIAVKLISALPQVQISGVLYFAVVLSFSIWMWASWVDYNTRMSRKVLIRTIAIVLTIIAGIIFFKPPAGEIINWQLYDAEKIEAAKKEGRPVLIKFIANWCMSCQVAEKMVYHREDIGRLIEKKKVLAIKADTTTADMPATAALKEIYNEPGVPVTILYLPGKKEEIRWHGMYFGDELKKQLEKLPDK